MNRVNILKHHGKTMLILALCLCIPFISIWYAVSYITENIFHKQKQDSLMAMAKVLESHLVAGGYDEILANAGMKDATREEQIAALNAALREMTDEVAQSSEGMGVGYYSYKLDAILTYGPSAEYQHMVGVPIGKEHPGRRVMATGNPEVTMGTMVRGHIMNAMLPVVRNGEVIGYIWANNLVSELEQTLSQMSSIVLLLLIASYILMLIIIVAFIRRIIKSDQKRDKILSVMNRVATILLAETNEEHFEKSLLDSMEIIGQSMEADCVQIWQNETRDGELCFALKYKWLSEAGKGVPPVEIGTAIPYSQRWKELFLRGENVNGPISSLPQEDQDLLSPLGLLSTITMSLYYQDSFWGVFCVDDVIKERYFKQDELNVLRSVALMLVNAINRNSIQRELKAALEKTENVLEQSELQIARLDMAIQASKVGLWEMEIVEGDPVNPNNIFIWSDEFRHMLGYKDESDFPNILSSWSDLLHPDDKDKALDAFAAHLLDATGKTPYGIDYRLFKKDSEYSYYHAAGVTVRDKKGNPIRVVGTLVDITETKNIMLDSERQRIQAEAANKAKSNFLSTMSHELRTPMNAIIGMTAIGKLTNDVQKKDDALMKIDGASKHLLEIINDVLDMSKIEADKFDLSPVSFDIEQMLQKIGDIINQRMDERRQKFFVQIGKDVPRTLIGDDLRLTQVITNLLSNAVKFTPEEGTIRLDLQFLSEENGICRLQISVEDTGIGITDEQKSRLFKAFEQAEATTTRKYGGTGLGLAIIKRIVELMDGEIWVESELGKGSKFICTVLMKRSIGIEKHLPDESLNGENINGKTEVGADDFTGYTILLADDVEINREILLALLEPTGLAVDCAEDGVKALALFREAPDKYSMIFMDIQMPLMDGYEATRQIRALGSAAAVSVPIVAMTANVFREDIEKSIEVGMNGHIGKPIDLNEVMKELRQYLR